MMKNKQKKFVNKINIVRHWNVFAIENSRSVDEPIEWHRHCHIDWFRIASMTVRCFIQKEIIKKKRSPVEQCTIVCWMLRLRPRVMNDHFIRQLAMALMPLLTVWRCVSRRQSVVWAHLQLRRQFHHAVWSICSNRFRLCQCHSPIWIEEKY